jgi:paraquat-inducible protein A
MVNTDIYIAKDYPHQAKLLTVLLLVNIVLLVVGIAAPIITLEKFILIENTFSILSGSVQLFKEGKYFLFIIITSFSILLPLLKIAVLLMLVTIKENKTINLHQGLHWMHQFGKWSMLDVFVVAILVVTVKLGAIASVEARYGIYLFTAAAFLIMYITSRVVTLTNPSKET